MTPTRSKPTFLYRCYDAERRLLYVGITLTPTTRFRSSHAKKAWWSAVRTVDVEMYASRAEAEAAEREAVQREWPELNERLWSTFEMAATLPDPFRSRRPVLIEAMRATGGHLFDLMEEWRYVEGRSFEAISRTLYAEYGVDTTGSTVQRWLADAKAGAA